MIENRVIRTGPEDAGGRLDTWLLRKYPSSSRSLIRLALERGDITVGDRVEAKGWKVRPGEDVIIRRLRETPDVRVTPNPALPLEVCHEEDVLLGLNKPAGQPTHPLDPDETGTLANALVARYPETAELGDHPLMAGLLHRLDTDTSGLVLAARRADVFAALRMQFQARTVEKVYLAVVRGQVRRAGAVKAPLVHEPSFRGRMHVCEGDPPGGQRALPAETEFEPVERRGAFTLLRVTIRSGVTHQIRCHLAYAGHPIAGDRLYGADAGTGNPDFGRQLLHAWSATFRHPVSGTRTTLAAPVPADLRDGFGWTV